MSLPFGEESKDNGGSERRNGAYLLTAKKCINNGAMTQKLMREESIGSINTEEICDTPSSDHHCRRRLSRSTRLIIMLTMTFAFFAVELAFGYLSHSMALVADSFHMLSDVMALSIAFACLRHMLEKETLFSEIAARSTKKNTFGWVRAEVLGALINGVFLLALCFSILVESLTRLVEPQTIKKPISVLINLFFYGKICQTGHAHEQGESGGDAQAQPQVGRRQTHVTIDGNESQHLMSSHQEAAMAIANLQEVHLGNSNLITQTHMRVDKSKEKKRKKLSKQLNMQGVFLHVLSDAVGSVIVIITALVCWLLPGQEVLKLYLDPTLSLAMVALMIASTFPLVRETALILMQTTPGFIEVEEIKKELLKIKGIEAVHEFHVWRLVGERIIATVHIKFADLKAYLAAADEIRTLFHNNCIHSTTIQPEFSEMASALGNDGTSCALACPPENCKRNNVTCCKRTLEDSSVSSNHDSVVCF
uniref:Cation efflux protein cytoplasmic domain-containing protein n=1 Tax=Setaria digitata TaxID=48799 RepID=A0A915Q286_9BILA